MSSIPPDLTIAAVSSRTGVSVPSLRAWERRLGFPEPRRLPGGHRRYSEDDVAAIKRVLAEREAGLSLEAAIELVTASDDTADATLHAGLRRRRPDLLPHVLSRRAMLAVSRAIEDESLASADRPHLVAAFQRATVYRAARHHRWSALARSAASTLIFADFSRSRVGAAQVREIAIPRNAPQEREWAVVCDGSQSSAVVAGWERPDGMFEAVWTVEPAVVRAASQIAHQLAKRFAPSLPLPTLPPPSQTLTVAAVARAVSTANRIVAYLDAADR